MAKITSEILRASAPLTKKASRDRFLPYLNLLLPHFKITTKRRVNAFLATCCIESAYWRATSEYGKGKGRPYSKVYADTGKAYYGRGIIQNTWRQAYEDFTAYVKRNWSWLKDLAGVDEAPNFVENPDLLTQPFWAVLAACWFWHRNKLNSYADKNDFFSIQGIVNRGNAAKKALHYNDRFAVYEKLNSVVSDNFALDSAATSDTVSIPIETNKKPAPEAETSANSAQNSKPEPPPEANQSMGVNTPEQTPADSNTESQPGTPPQTETLVKERPSLFVKIFTGLTAAVGTITGFGINLAAIVQNKLEQITPAQIFYLVLGLAFVALAVYLYDKSAQRANRLNMEKLKFAADKSLNTVELVMKPEVKS